MRIKVDMKVKTALLIPLSSGEQKGLKTVLTALPVRGKNTFGIVSDGEFLTVNLWDRASRKNLIEFRGNTKNDDAVLRHIRSCQRFTWGKAGFVLLGEKIVKGKKCVQFTLRLCTKCGGNTFAVRDVESGICDDCAGKCIHEYEEKMGFLRGMPQMVFVCKHCFTPRPETPEERAVRERKSTLEHQIECSAKTGVTFINLQEDAKPGTSKHTKIMTDVIKRATQRETEG